MLRSLLLVSLSGLALSGTLLAGIDFESSEGFTAGQDISKTSGWSETGPQALVSNQDAHSGSQSLEMSANATVTYSIPAVTWPSVDRVAWIDFWIKPEADASAEPSTTLDADGCRLAFIKSGGEGTVYAFNPDGNGNGGTVSSGVSFPLDTDGHSAQWIRVTLRQDFQGQTWDLFINGTPALGNLRMDNATPKAGPTEFTLVSPVGGNTRLDEWNLTLSNPLFPDADNDGIPDTYERVLGFDPYVSNRAGNLDPAGAREFQKFLASVRSAQPSSSSASGSTGGRLIYVDQKIGNDSNNGLLCYNVAAAGPKASIHAAMAVATKGDTLIVNEGVYREGSISLIGKPFNLKTIGTVKF
jgi:hypothetical protein